MIENKSSLDELIEKAESNDSESQYLLGCSYKLGTKIERDPVKARYWFERAADSGHAKAQYNFTDNQKIFLLPHDKIGIPPH